MKTRTWLFFLLLFLNFSKPSIAKDYPMLHYTIEDGLASNTIYDIYQDPNGMIWIGTDKGISRFNGLKFENFTTADGLSDNECFFFQPDYEGRLWIGTFNGKLCYYKDGVFHNEQNTPWLKLKINASHITNIRLEYDSSISIIYQNSPIFIEVQKENLIFHSDSFMKIQQDQLTYFNGSHILGIKKINKHIYDIYYDYGIYHFSKSEKSFKKYNFSERYVKRAKSANKSLLISENGNILDIEKNAIIYKDENYFTKKQVNDILLLDSLYFSASSNGLFVNNKEIKSGSINSISKDNNGNYWVGTTKNGILTFTSNFRNWGLFKIPNELNIVFAGKVKNNLLFTTKEKKTYILPTSESNIINIHKNNIENKATKDFSFGNIILADAFYQFNSNDLTKISFSEKSHIKYFRAKVKRPFAFDNTKKANSNSEYLYIQCAAHISYLKISDLISNKQNIGASFVLTGQKLYDIKTDCYDRTWVSGFEHLYTIKDSALNTQPQFKNISFREFIFAKQYLLGITHQNQLVICNNYYQEQISLDTVFADNCVWDKFYTLNDSTILISTNNFFRTIRLKPSKNKAIYQLRVIENPIIPYQPDFVYADSNEIYFFKKNEIKSFPTSYILEENTLPSIQFSYLKTNQDKIFIKDTVVLNYKQSRDLKVLFTPISYYHQKLVYEYSISEKNDKANWNSFEGEELNLIKIGYGKFTIKVRAKTLSGDYSSPAKFILVVNKPFWATWWFLGFCLLLLIALAATIARYGVKRKLKKKESEVRFIRSEYKAMNALMNPHFIFNSLNSVQSLVNNNENKTASRYIRIFSDLIRQNMRNIEQELIPISKELDLVENYLKIEKLRFKEKLNFSIHIDEDVETDLIFVPPLLIQPLVENAIKHGIWPKKTSDGYIKLNLFEKENILFIEISDNGIGFNSITQSDTMHESYAMSNIYTRIEQLSKIHQTKIECHIAEIKNENDLVLGVKSVISIHLPK